jgi:predicted SAM-dependent methyltransferase
MRGPVRLLGGALLRWRQRVRDQRNERRAELRAAARDRHLLDSLRGRTDLRINVGASSSHLEGWLSADLLRDPEGRCIQMDATRPWPFESGSAMAVNSEHFVEHLEIEDAAAYFREAFRVLRAGGVIRTSTPDLEGLYSVYRERDPSLLELHREHGYTASCHGDLVNNYFYLMGHRHIYDLEKLGQLLMEAGFEGLERAGFGESSHPLLRGIDGHDVGALEQTVLVVDAMKPPSHV